MHSPIVDGWCHVTSLRRQVPEYIIMPKHSSLNTISQSFQQIKSPLDTSCLTNSPGVKTKEGETQANESRPLIIIAHLGQTDINVMLLLMIRGRDLIVIT